MKYQTLNAHTKHYDGSRPCISPDAMLVLQTRLRSTTTPRLRTPVYPSGQQQFEFQFANETARLFPFN